MVPQKALVLTTIVLAGIVLLQPNVSYARDSHRDYRHDDRYEDRHAYRYHDAPRNGFSISFGGTRFWYSEGRYYRFEKPCVVYRPPVTYVQVPSHVLVAGPTVIHESTPVVLQEDGFYTVNIPNEKTGGYTEVTLKRTDKGFLGPQGEFYPDFPKVAQLKAMYVK